MITPTCNLFSSFSTSRYATGATADLSSQESLPLLHRSFRKAIFWMIVRSAPIVEERRGRGGGDRTQHLRILPVVPSQKGLGGTADKQLCGRVWLANCHFASHRACNALLHESCRAAMGQTKFSVGTIKNLDNSGVMLFPKLLVCVACGFSRFTVSKAELASLTAIPPTTQLAATAGH
jgi:hypothetical protein